MQKEVFLGFLAGVVVGFVLAKNSHFLEGSEDPLSEVLQTLTKVYSPTIVRQS